ncbi:MAG: site-specific integrase [Proteobacteria bacterium]|nr:site-specific integrase [Pseudomonadota bacterium]
MEHSSSESSNTYGELHMTDVRVGRVRFKSVLVKGREAAFDFYDLLGLACERTKHQGSSPTRYAAQLPMGAPARLLSVEIADYLKDMERRGLRKTTIQATGRTLAILLIACGNIPVSRIEHKHIYLLWDLLRWAPKNVTTAAKLKGKTADEIIAIGKGACVESPAVATYELHRRFLSTFFSTLVKAHAIPHSPMEAFGELKKDLIRDEDKVERLFSDDDLKRIFHPMNFVPWASKFPHRWWGPILGLYTGARINEIAQLKVKDIINERGVWCIAIQKTADADLKGNPNTRSRQSLKGKSAIRTIPIPEPVLKAGFLEFVEDIKAFGHPRLFPHLSAGINRKTGETNARYSNGFLNQFAVYMKGLGFPKGVGFHAFRHTLATELENLEVREETIALITGHSVSKKVPVLQDAYIHKKPDRIRVRQTEALAKFKPPVTLPSYKRGQFRDRLCRGVKVYP